MEIIFAAIALVVVIVSLIVFVRQVPGDLYLTI